MIEEIVKARERQEGASTQYYGRSRIGSLRDHWRAVGLKPG